MCERESERVCERERERERGREVLCELVEAPGYLLHPTHLLGVQFISIWVDLQVSARVSQPAPNMAIKTHLFY